MRVIWRFIVALTLLPIYQPGASAQAQAQPAPSDIPPPPASVDKEAAALPDSRESMCLMIESAARANHLPLEFFARVIWQESRFQADAIGPPTRTGERAQGIAQFMPRTAADRQLLNPFDPVQALPKSAEFLHQLRDQFGNLGLAAAAYNAGPQAVRDWMKGARMLPGETRHYVLAITGTSVDEWAKGAKGEPGQPGTLNCRQLMALLRRAPNPFVERLEERINLVSASPWGIQLSAGYSRDRALAAYATVAKRYGQVLAGRDPSILSITLHRPTSPTFYQVRVGAKTREDANSLCANIKRAGGACMVLRNTRGAS